MERPSRLQVEREWCRTEFQDANLSMATDSKWLAELAGHEFDERWLARINEELIPLGSLELDEDNKDLYSYAIPARLEFFDNMLDWGDKASPMHPTFQKFLEVSPQLAPLATVIERFRHINADGKNVAHAVMRFPKVLSIDDQWLHLVMTSIDDATAESLQPATPVVPTIEPVVPVVKEPPVQKAQAPKSPRVRTKISAEDYHTPDEMERLLKVFANYGVDAASVLASKSVGLNNPVDVIESRLQGLVDEGLNPASIVEAYEDVLTINKKYIREKVPVIRTFLDALHSDLPTPRFINDKPRMLGRSASRLLTVGTMLEGSTDLTGLPSGQVEAFARHSFDTDFAALIDSSRRSELVWAKDLSRIGHSLKLDERRPHNLESLRNTAIRKSLSKRAIHAYLTAQPLTQAELASYPDLATL